MSFWMKLLVLLQFVITWQATFVFAMGSREQSPEKLYLEKLTFPKNGTTVTGCPSKFTELLMAEELKNDIKNKDKSSVKFIISCHYSDDNEILLNFTKIFSNVRDLWITAAKQKHFHPIQIRVPKNEVSTLTSLHVIDVRFPNVNGRFSFLSQLRNLQIVDMRGPFTLMDDDEYSDTTVNKLDSVYIVKEVTAALAGISTLNTLYFERFQGYGLMGNGILNISELLYPLMNSKLQNLGLVNLGISIVLPGLSKVAPHLKILDFEGNAILSHLENLVFLGEVIVHPTLEVAKFVGMSSGETETKTMITGLTDHQSHSQTTKSLYRYKRQVDGGNTDVLSFCLRHFNLTFNDLFVNQSALCTVVKCCFDRGQFSIITKNIPCEAFDFFNWFKRGFRIRPDCHNGFPWPIGGNLRKLIIDRFQLPLFNIYVTGPSNISAKTCFIQNNLMEVQLTNVPHIFFSENMQTSMTTGVYKGFEKVKVLNLSGNRIHFTRLDILLSRHPLLQTLNLSRNFLSDGEETFRLCKTSTYMENIDFSETNVTLIGHKWFENCTNLKYVNLARNNIKRLDFQIHSTILQELNFHSNPITFISSDFQNRLNELSATMQQKYNQPLKIDLTGTLFLCDCSELETISWIHSSHKMKLVNFINYDKYTCRFGRDLVKLADFDINHLIYQCSRTEEKITISVTNIIAVLIGIAAFSLYRFRYRIYLKWVWVRRWLLKKCKRKNHPNHTGSQEESLEIYYDAYLAFCSKDRFLVNSAMLHALESTYGFHLCNRYRDFLIGGDIAETIIEAMQRSKSIILVVSSEALQKPWFKEEVRMAFFFQGNYEKNVIVLKLGKVENACIENGRLKQVFGAKAYYEFPDYVDDDIIRNRPGPDHDEYSNGISGSNIPLIPRNGNSPRNMQPHVDPKSKEIKEKYKVMTKRQNVFWAKIASKLWEN